MSISGLIAELNGIKTGSDDLSKLILGAAQNLQTQSTDLMKVGQGKGSAEAAAKHVLKASKSLNDAAACLRTLTGDISNVISEIKR